MDTRCQINVKIKMTRFLGADGQSARQNDHDGIIRSAGRYPSARYGTVRNRYSQHCTMIGSPDVQLSSSASCADSDKENFDTSCQHNHADQKFGVNVNNAAYTYDKDTPITLPLDGLSLVESDLDLNISSEPSGEPNAKERIDLEVGPISILGVKNDSTQNENSMTTITPIPVEHAIDSPTAGPAPDIERGMAAYANEASGTQTRVVDNSVTVEWSAIARGEKLCGTTLPRFFWLAVLLGLLAVLCASVGYLMHSLRLLE